MSEPVEPGPSDGPAPAPSPDAASAPVSSGQVADVQRSFLRLTFWQTVLSLAGVFTGAVALYAALNESQAVREQTAASVWPYVQLMIYDTDDGKEASFSLSFENVGVGPALMGGVRLSLADEPVTSWDAVTGRLLDEPQQVGVDFGRSSVSRRVIAPGEAVVAFQTQKRPLVLRIQEALGAGDLALTYCYCDIFDACWQSLGWGPAGEPRIESVKACPDSGEASFRD